MTDGFPRLQERPLCRCCGKPLRLRTAHHYVKVDPARAGQNETQMNGWCVNHYVAEKIRDPKALQRFTNREIVSVNYMNPGREKRKYAARYHYTAEEIAEADAQGRWVYGFTSWDRESYEDDLFCGSKCAERWARLFARTYPTLRTQAFANAVAKREKKEQAK